ncbi:hypothetical protein DRO59_00550 [Candidatus Bathyarchaeota archaeon]|nr:MAG: hypothetical protein DRO59_00550 [Candidatus Bathyarchaeota archaeon]
MTTVKRRPSYTEGGWENPQNLFEDGKHCEGVDGASQTLTQYGFSIPSDATITKVIARIKGYETYPDNDYTYFGVWDGSEWKGILIPLEGVDSAIEVDITDLVSWTPDLLNNLKTELSYTTYIIVSPKSKGSPLIDYVEIEATYSSPYPTAEESTQLMLQTMQQFMSIMFTFMFMMMIISMMSGMISSVTEAF